MLKQLVNLLLLLNLISFSNTSSKNKVNDSIHPRLKYYGAFVESEITEISPESWLKEYLNRQAKGLTGNLEVAGFPFNSTGWYDTAMAEYGWVVYEQNAYWLDGMSVVAN
jgi:hypothetical protein